MAAEAKLRLSVQGASRVRNTLRGIRRDSRSAGNEQQRSARDGARITERAERDKQRSMGTTDRLMHRFTEGQLSEARRAAREQVRISARMQRERVREAERAARREAAIRKRLAQQSRTGSGGGGGVSRLGGAVVGGVAGGIAGTVAVAGKMRGIAGIKSQEQRIQDAADFDLRLRRLGAQAGLSDAQREELGGRIMAASMDTGLDQGELLAGMETAQERFPKAVDSLRANLDSLAKTSMALAVPFEGLIGAAGTAADRLGLTEQETKRFLDMMAAAGAEGVIEVPDFSAAFAPVMGSFTATTGRTGMEGAREFLGLAQAIGTNQAGASQNATQLEAMLKAVSTGPSRDAIIKMLGTGTGDAKGNRELAKRMRQGQDVGLLEVVQALAKDERFGGARIMQTLGRQEAAQGFIAAVGEERKLMAGKTNTAASRIAQTDAGAGAALISEAFGSVMESEGAQFAKQAAEAQADITRNLEDYAKHVTAMNDASLAFEKAVGEYGLYTGVFATAAAGLGGASLLQSLTGGPGGKMPALDKLAKVAKAGGKAGLLGMIGAGVYGLTDLAFEKSGAKEKILRPVGEAFYDLFHDSPDELVNKAIGGGKEGLALQKKQLTHAERQTRALESLARNNHPAKGDAGPPKPQRDVPGREGR